MRATTQPQTSQRGAANQPSRLGKAKTTANLRNARGSTRSQHSEPHIRLASHDRCKTTTTRRNEL